MPYRGSPTLPSPSSPRHHPLTLTPGIRACPPLAATDLHPLPLSPGPSSHSGEPRRLCTSFWSACSACNSVPSPAGATRRYALPWCNCHRWALNPMGSLPASFPVSMVEYRLQAWGPDVPWRWNLPPAHIASSRRRPGGPAPAINTSPDYLPTYLPSHPPHLSPPGQRPPPIASLVPSPVPSPHPKPLSAQQR